MTHEQLTEVLRLHALWLTGAATGQRANLAWANLAWANLVEANLVEANLAGANLAGANLAWANLAGANLAGADLAGANLERTYLAGANLRGAIIADDRTLAGASPIAQIGPVGSRDAMLVAYRTNAGVYFQAGCFEGDADELRSAVVAKHAGTKHEADYMTAIAALEALLGGDA